MALYTKKQNSSRWLLGTEIVWSGYGIIVQSLQERTDYFHFRILFFCSSVRALVLKLVCWHNVMPVVSLYSISCEDRILHYITEDVYCENVFDSEDCMGYPTSSIHIAIQRGGHWESLASVFRLEQSNDYITYYAY
jgi:hypothetical protein